MATLFINSTADKAKAEHLLQRIEDGTLPKPPLGTQKRNVCEMCQATTVLRYYIQSHGWCCGECLDASRAAPVWCNTRADQVHRGRFHIIPQCVIDADATSNAPVAFQDAPKARVFIWDAKQAEEAWTKARKAGEAKRGNVMVMPWKMPA